MHVVAVLAPEGVVAFDLGVPCQVFASARSAAGERLYDVRVCGQGRASASAVDSPVFEFFAPFTIDDARTADTVIVPGVGAGSRRAEPSMLATLRAAADAGARIASICTGAFLLAEAGLLAGRTATTHWRAADKLADRFPDVRVDPSVLFVDTGQVLTSAGVAAGMDLCLHMVGSDHGAAVAAATARVLVVPPRRSGGQAQFVEHVAPDAGEGGSLQPTLDWMNRNLHRTLTIKEIACRAGTSVRTLHRRFVAQVGSTPLAWLRQVQVERARELLETTDLPIDQVADLSGFGSAVTLRVHFSRRFGVSPVAHRAAFR